MSENTTSLDLNYLKILPLVAHIRDHVRWICLKSRFKYKIFFDFLELWMEVMGMMKAIRHLVSVGQVGGSLYFYEIL